MENDVCFVWPLYAILDLVHGPPVVNGPHFENFWCNRCCLAIRFSHMIGPLHGFDFLVYMCLFSIEAILRAEAVETAQAGDQCGFTGGLIVVPDVGSLSMPGTLD